MSFNKNEIIGLSSVFLIILTLFFGINIGFKTLLVVVGLCIVAYLINNKLKILKDSTSFILSIFIVGCLAIGLFFLYMIAVPMIANI
jgi:hypothetical protein